MATYSSSAVTAAGPIRRDINGLTSRTVSFTTTATIATGDVFEMVPVPKGATVIDFLVSARTSPGTTVPLNVGDGGSTARYLSAAAWGGSTSVFRPLAGATRQYTYTADDTIDLVLGTVSAGASAGVVIDMTVVYTTDI